MARPFRVRRRVDGSWYLTKRPFGPSPEWNRFGFTTAGEAIDYAYKNWQWWP